MKSRYLKLVCSQAVCTHLTEHLHKNGVVHTPFGACDSWRKYRSVSGDFFRREKLHFVNELSAETNADSHESYFLWYCVFYIDVE